MFAPRFSMMAIAALAGAFALEACGGGGNTSSNNNPNAGGSASSAPAASTTTPAPAPATSAATGAAMAPMPPTGKTVKVKMVGDAKGYREDPMNVTVKVGDAVQWVNVSGGPHNVSFYPDSIPTGTQGQLDANMPAQTGTGPAQKLGPVVGPLLTNPNDTYTISFAGVKPGVYKYFCTPHAALGMKGSVTVQ